MQWNLKNDAPKFIKALKLSGKIKDKDGKTYTLDYVLQTFDPPIATADLKEVLIDLT